MALISAEIWSVNLDVGACRRVDTRTSVCVRRGGVGKTDDKRRKT
jgi:hypothetical protein